MYERHDLPAAARRHLEAARALANGTNRRDVAGYLYGIAAECAVKAMATDTPLLRRDDVLFAHFPELRTLLRDALHGRRGTVLKRFIDDNAFMENWHVRMRYTDGREVTDARVARWAEQAGDVVNAMGT